jgi:hypothetical protein
VKRNLIIITVFISLITNEINAQDTIVTYKEFNKIPFSISNEVNLTNSVFKQKQIKYWENRIGSDEHFVDNN